MYKINTKFSHFLTNVDHDCAMRKITSSVVDFFYEKLSSDATFIDLTWINQYDSSINDINAKLIIALDVADPPYYFEEKIDWLSKVRSPVFYVGPLIKNLPCPTIPFFGWLRFRPQQLIEKIKYENFFVSFNRKPHIHRKQFFNALKSHSHLISDGYVSFFEELPKSEISSLSLDLDIVKLQSLAQQIDEKQLYSSFEIVCETSATNYHIFLTEKFNKCVASETPLLLLGDYKTLFTLKKYYGFTDFGPDDSYDLEPLYHNRVSKVLNIASNFYDYPLRKVFDNAKRNAEHLQNNFDAIHDNHVYKTYSRAVKCLR